jgi:hypothetical protein
MADPLARSVVDLFLGVCGWIVDGKLGLRIRSVSLSYVERWCGDSRQLD